MTVEPTRAATGCVRRWVRTALLAEAKGETRGEDIAEYAAEPAPASAALQAEDLLAAVVRQRVVEVVHAHADVLDLPHGLADGIAQLRVARRELVPLQLLELARIRELFDGAGVPFLSVKGPVLAVQTTGDVGARGFGDLDVLVDPTSVGALVDLLGAHGWRSSVPLPDQASWAWRRLLYTSNELTFYGASCSVDLHWRLDPTIDGLPAFDVLWDRRVSVEVGGVVVPTLAPGDALAHLCLNAARDEWRWVRSLVDIHRVARLENAWKHQRMRGLAVAALIVTDALVGLPPDTPGWVRDRMARVPPRVRDRSAARHAARWNVLAKRPSSASRPRSTVTAPVAMARSGASSPDSSSRMSAPVENARSTGASPPGTSPRDTSSTAPSTRISSPAGPTCAAYTVAGSSAATCGRNAVRRSTVIESGVITCSSRGSPSALNPHAPSASTIGSSSRP